MPKVTIDFWDPIDNNGNHFDLLPVCSDVHGLRVRDRMQDRGTEYTDYVVHVESRDGQGFGMAARIRKENLPEKVNLQTGDVRPLDLLAQEGLAEEVHFLYDQGLQTLVTQRNRIFRASALVDLLRDLSGAMFGIQPKLREDAWQRFRRMVRIGSLELKLRTPDHHPNLSQTIPSMAEFLDDAADEVNAFTVDIKMSVERSKTRSLEVGIIRSLVNVFRREENLSKLVVSGNRGEGERGEIVDFIRDRLVHTGEVRYDGRQLDGAQCRQLLREALERHRPYLRTLL